MTKLARTRAKAGNNAKIRITKHVRVVWSVGCGSAGWHSGPGRVTRREIFESYSKSCNTLTPPQQPARRRRTQFEFASHIPHVTSVIANEPGLRAYSIRDQESDHGKYNGFKENMNKRRRESGFRAFNRCVLRRIRENSCERYTVPHINPYMYESDAISGLSSKQWIRVRYSTGSPK